jgi:hypothetical protein
MFDNNPFREFKKMMKERRLQENKYYGIDATGTDPTTGTGIERNITGPTAPSDVGMDYNSDRAELNRRGDTPKINKTPEEWRQWHAESEARAAKRQAELEAEAKELGIPVKELKARKEEEALSDRIAARDEADKRL